MNPENQNPYPSAAMPLPSATTDEQQLQPAASSPVESSGRRRFLWLLGGLATLTLGIAIGAIGAKFLNQSQSSSPLTSIPSPAQSPTPTSTPDPTTGWKTYTNSENNYLIRYPQNLTLAENGMSRGNIQAATAIVLYEDSKSTFESPRFAITVRSDPDTFENIVNKHYQKLTTNLLSEKERQTASQNIGYTISENKIVSPLFQATFNGFQAFQYLIKGSTVDDGAAEYGVPEEEHKYIWFETQRKFFLISFTNTNTIDQILATFKFLEQSEGNIYTGKYFSIDTSTWKLISDANQSPATPEVLETVSFENGQARMNVQVGTNSVEKVFSSQDGSVTGKQILAGVETIKKSGYGGIADSVYSVSLVAPYGGKSYLISFYTQDTKNISEYEQSFNQVISTFKFLN